MYMLHLLGLALNKLPQSRDDIQVLFLSFNEQLKISGIYAVQIKISGEGSGIYSVKPFLMNRKFKILLRKPNPAIPAVLRGREKMKQ